MKIRARDVADKIALEERSLKYFIAAWAIFIVALAVRLAISIQQYVTFESNPLLQPVPFTQRPQNIPYVVICYNSTAYSFYTSICINASLSTPEIYCSSELLVPTNNVSQCVLFNTHQEVATSTSTAYLNAIIILENITEPVTLPTLGYVTNTIMNTSDFISNLADITTVIPMFVNYPVFVGIQKQETIALNGSTKVSYSTSMSNAPFIPLSQYGPNANLLQLIVYFTSFTVNSIQEVNPMGIFDIFSSLGGIYSIIAAISGILFITNIKAPNRKFVLQKEKPTENEKSTEDVTKL